MQRQSSVAKLHETEEKVVDYLIENVDLTSDARFGSGEGSPLKRSFSGVLQPKDEYSSGWVKHVMNFSDRSIENQNLHHSRSRLSRVGSYVEATKRNDEEERFTPKSERTMPLNRSVNVRGGIPVASGTSFTDSLDPGLSDPSGIQSQIELRTTERDPPVAEESVSKYDEAVLQLDSDRPRNQTEEVADHRSSRVQLARHLEGLMNDHPTVVTRKVDAASELASSDLTNYSPYGKESGVIVPGGGKMLHYQSSDNLLLPDRSDLVATTPTEHGTAAVPLDAGAGSEISRNPGGIKDEGADLENVHGTGGSNLISWTVGEEKRFLSLKRTEWQGFDGVVSKVPSDRLSVSQNASNSLSEDASTAEKADLQSKGRNDLYIKDLDMPELQIGRESSLLDNFDQLFASAEPSEPAPVKREDRPPAAKPGAEYMFRTIPSPRQAPKSIEKHHVETANDVRTLRLLKERKAEYERKKRLADALKAESTTSKDEDAEEDSVLQKPVGGVVEVRADVTPPRRDAPRTMLGLSEGLSGNASLELKVQSDRLKAFLEGQAKKEAEERLSNSPEVKKTTFHASVSGEDIGRMAGSGAMTVLGDAWCVNDHPGDLAKREEAEVRKKQEAQKSRRRREDRRLLKQGNKPLPARVTGDSVIDSGDKYLAVEFRQDGTLNVSGSPRATGKMADKGRKERKIKQMEEQERLEEIENRRKYMPPDEMLNGMSDTAARMRQERKMWELQRESGQKGVLFADDSPFDKIDRVAEAARNAPKLPTTTNSHAKGNPLDAVARLGGPQRPSARDRFESEYRLRKIQEESVNARAGIVNRGKRMTMTKPAVSNTLKAL